jgi:hypothetical protein
MEQAYLHPNRYLCWWKVNRMLTCAMMRTRDGEGAKEYEEYLYKSASRAPCEEWEVITHAIKADQSSIPKFFTTRTRQ